jgi:hypothetical protein
MDYNKMIACPLEIYVALEKNSARPTSASEAASV